MPIIQVHKPDLAGPEGPLYIPTDKDFLLPRALADLAVRDASLSVYPGGYMGDITPEGWNAENSRGSFWLTVQDEGELAKVSFVPFGRVAPDIDLFRVAELDGQVTQTQVFDVHNGNCMAISRLTEFGIEIGGIVLHATNESLLLMNQDFHNYD